MLQQSRCAISGQEGNQLVEDFNMYVHIQSTCGPETSRLPQSFQEVTLCKSEGCERAAAQRCMGCHGRQASLGFTASLHHDQHLPHQPGSSAGASTPQPVPPGPHPSASSSTKQQQAHDAILALCRAIQFSAVCRRVHLPVSQLQQGKGFYMRMRCTCPQFVRLLHICVLLLLLFQIQKPLVVKIINFTCMKDI